MDDTVSRTDAIVALLAGLMGVAGSYAVTGYTREFVIAPIDAFVVRSTPGAIVTFIIANVGDPGHLLHIALSIAIATSGFAAASLLGIVAARRFGRPMLGVGVAGIAAWGITAGLTAEPVLAVAAGIPVALLTAVQSASRSSPERDPSRRRAILSGVSALGFLGVAGVLGRSGADASDASTESSATGTAAAGSSGSDASAETVASDVDSESAATEAPQQSAVERKLTLAQDNSLAIASDDVPGLVSPIKNFYNVDINEFDPEVPSAGWSMTITGQVDEDVTVSYADLTERPVEHRFVTLRCVGEDLNGRKLDTAVWTGTPIKPLLDAADPNGECGCVMLRAEDGYFVQFPVEALEDGLLAWKMNGQPLPKSHGHPVRVLVPGHWGETNVKWLDEIELLDEEMKGYWEKRGWHGTGPVNTVAKLWDTTELDDGRVEVAGHAYAGTRGVSRVDVSVDGGNTWADATLSEPLPGDDVWRQWRHVFEPDGTHEVVVRAVDGTGTVQPKKQSGPVPSGATGWVSKTINK